MDLENDHPCINHTLDTIVSNLPFTTYYPSDSIPLPEVDSYVVVPSNGFTLTKKSPLSNVYNCFSTSVEEQHREGSFRIYPNPSSSIIHLAGDVDAVEEVVLYSMEGQRRPVNYSPSGTSGGSIDVSSLPHGLYVLHVTADGKRFSRTVVIE